MQYLEEMWKWKVSVFIFVVALTMFFISACGGSSEPTEADARAAFEKNHSDVKVISFKATNAGKVIEIGKNKKRKFIAYKAEVECLQDISLNFAPCKKGDKKTIKGDIRFTNDGEGWKADE